MMRRRRKQSTISASTARLLLFGSFFCAGSVVGFLSTRFVSNDARNQITAYLQAYVACTAGKAAAGTFFAVFVSYLRYPLIAFLIGILGGGMLLLPLLCTAQGFSLAFAVQCFAAGFGRQGTLTALSLSGSEVFSFCPVRYILPVQHCDRKINGSRMLRMITAPLVFAWGYCCLALCWI